MSVLHDFLGTVFGGNTYSTKECFLSEEEIRKYVSPERVSSLTQEECRIIERALLERRRGDGKISLAQIHEVLVKLESSHIISEYDKEGLIKVFRSVLKSR